MPSKKMSSTSARFPDHKEFLKKSPTSTPVIIDGIIDRKNETSVQQLITMPVTFSVQAISDIIPEIVAREIEEELERIVQGEVGNSIDGGNYVGFNNEEKETGKPELIRVDIHGFDVIGESLQLNVSGLCSHHVDAFSNNRFLNKAPHSFMTLLNLKRQIVKVH